MRPRKSFIRPPVSIVSYRVRLFLNSIVLKCQVRKRVISSRTDGAGLKPISTYITIAVKCKKRHWVRSFCPKIRFAQCIIRWYGGRCLAMKYFMH